MVDIWFKDRLRRWLVPQNTELLEARRLDGETAARDRESTPAAAER